MQPDPSVNPGEMILKTYAAMGRLLAERGVETRLGARFLHGYVRTDLLKLARRHAYLCGRAGLRARASGEQVSNNFAET